MGTVSSFAGAGGGDGKAGECVRRKSSESDTCPLSRDAEKLVDISGSERKAYDDCVEVVEIVEVVRSLAERRDDLLSSCQAELPESMLLYSRP